VSAHGTGWHVLLFRNISRDGKQLGMSKALDGDASAQVTGSISYAPLAGLPIASSRLRRWTRLADRCRKAMVWWVYIRDKQGKLYVGITTDPKNRMRQHRGTLLYRERFKTRGEAAKRECEIKGWRREKRLSLIRRRQPE
jgi:predicted GIY-YIG superfamily endonuclease